METMTSENIYRIEITESNVPAQVLEKEIKTENNNDYTKTITKLKRDTGMVKKTKTIIYFKQNKHAKTNKRRRVIRSDSDD